MTESSTYRTAPQDTDQMPSGIPYIVSNEAAERFSFYGMKGILTVFMMKYLLGPDGQPDGMNEEDARTWYHGFTTAVYFFPILGALLADLVFGKYRIILSLSIVYVLGHAVLAVMDFPAATGVAPRTALFVGLGLIAIGSGGIKPCVTAHVGDQFGRSNSHLLETVFSWFYFSINLGATVSTLATPWVLATYGPGWAFGIPGVLMAVATVFFWMGRNDFAHIPVRPQRLINDLTSKEGVKAIVGLIPLYIFVAMFWALFDQTGSAWVQQADHMDRTVPLFGELLPSQIQAANPILVMMLIPVFSIVIYPFVRKFTAVTPLRKIGTGMFLTAVPFAITAWIETRIDAGETPSIVWQLLAYFILTAAEVMVSITFLEFSYTQAPRAIKSIIMSLAMLSISLGNVFIAGVNWYIGRAKAAGSNPLEGAAYYWFFFASMLVFAVGFLIWSQFYKGQTYLQDDAPETDEAKISEADVWAAESN